MSKANGNAAIWFVDRHAATDYKHKLAFVEGPSGKAISYEDLALESGKMADLYRQHNIRSEDRVAMLVLDVVEFPIIFWGSLKAGVVPVAFNTLLSTDIYEYMLRDSRARALFVSQALLPAVESLFEKIDTLETVFVVGDEEPEGATLFSEAIGGCEQRAPVFCSTDECAFWLYSSGSTGQPKGVRHAHGSLQATVETYGVNVLGIERDDVVYSAAKLFFAYGLGNAMTFPMSVGATAVLLPDRPTPDGVFDILNKHEPTIFCGVPTLYAAMVAGLESGAHKIAHKLRRCLSAGEALPRDVGMRWEQHAGCEILDGVGSTEMLHIFLSNAPGDVDYGTSGTAVPGYEIRLVDDMGNEVGDGEVGELLVKGDSSAIEYWNLREKSRSTFEGWWTRTGDKYERSPNGRMIYCGRTDDMFKVSGIWVSPFEVEQALIEHTNVLEAAVVAERDEEGLEKPKAFVVLKEPIADEGFTRQLQEHVKNSIGKWKYPRWIEIVDELPKTATGKIQRFKLRST